MDKNNSNSTSIHFSTKGNSFRGIFDRVKCSYSFLLNQALLEHNQNKRIFFIEKNHSQKTIVYELSLSIGEFGKNFVFISFNLALIYKIMHTVYIYKNGTNYELGCCDWDRIPEINNLPEKAEVKFKITLKDRESALLWKKKIEEAGAKEFLLELMESEVD